MAVPYIQNRYVPPIIIGMEQEQVEREDPHRHRFPECSTQNGSIEVTSVTGMIDQIRTARTGIV
jgi:hypothetical protein